jgi:CBS domain-containing protein
MSLDRFRRPIVTADASETVKRVAIAMREQGVGCVVITKDGRPLGIVTDRDLVVRVVADGIDASAPVGDVATFGPLTLSTHDTVETATTCMRTHGVRRLPLVDDNGSVVGIVTADDLLMMLGRGLADLCEGVENRSDATDSR